MKANYTSARRFGLLLALAILLTGLPCAAAAGSFEAVVTVDAMNVYAQAAPHDLVGTLPRGTTVTVLKWSGKAALISSGSVSGIARVSEMSRVAPTPTPAQTPAPSQTMVTNQRTRVYRQPTSTSRYATLEAGITVQVLSVNGNYARVSMNGNVGYMLYGHH